MLNENTKDVLSNYLLEVDGIIRKAKEVPGTKWELPYTLFKRGLSGWQVVGRYKSEKHAKAAAKRFGITITDI